jgi:hypothetical protein
LFIGTPNILVLPLGRLIGVITGIRSEVGVRMVKRDVLTRSSCTELFRAIGSMRCSQVGTAGKQAKIGGLAAVLEMDIVNGAEALYTQWIIIER